VYFDHIRLFFASEKSGGAVSSAEAALYSERKKSSDNQKGRIRLILCTSHQKTIDRPALFEYSF